MATVEPIKSLKKIDEIKKALEGKNRRDFALSVTGIAGPDGGTKEKPVGTVYICLSDNYLSDPIKYHFSGDRNRVQTLAVHTALNNLRLYLIKRSQSDLT